MPTLTVTKNYANATVLTEGQLDDIKTSIETFVNTTKLDSTNIQTGGLATTNYAAVSVDTAALASNSVTTIKITDANVTTAKIADSNVTTAKIADSNVTTAKIADLNVTAAKIANNTITATQISTTLSLPITASVNGKYPVVSSTNPASSRLAIIRGYVSSAASIVSGEGFSVVKNSTGNYTVTFSNAFTSTPAVIFTACEIGMYAGAQLTATSASAFTLVIRTTDLADSAFSFIAAGTLA